MAVDPLTAGLELGKSILERFIPDPAQKAKAMLDLEELHQKGELQQMMTEAGLMQGQIDVNKIEAASSSLFVAGWRPWVGWTAGVSLGLAYIPKAIVLCLVWTVQAFTAIKGWDGHSALVLQPYPDMALTDIIGLLGSLLGFGAMRSYDKQQGTTTGH
jgi:hypothetical protein